MIKLSYQRTLDGHNGDVSAVIFSPDGKLLASGSKDGTVHIWRVGDWTIIQNLEISIPILDLAFTSDTQLFGIYTMDNLELWYVPGWEYVNGISFELNEGVSLAISPDGELIAHGTFSGQVKIYHSPDLSLIETLHGHSNPVADIEFSPDGQYLASSAIGEAIELWRLSDGMLLRTFGTGVYDITFSPDGKILASGGTADNPACLWKVTTGLPLYTFEHTMWDVDYSPNGDFLAGLTHNNIVEMWNIADMTLWYRLNTYTSVSSMAFSADGALLAFGSPDGSVQIWQIIP